MQKESHAAEDIIDLVESYKTFLQSYSLFKFPGNSVSQAMNNVCENTVIFLHTVPKPVVSLTH